VILNDLSIRALGSRQVMSKSRRRNGASDAQMGARRTDPVRSALVVLSMTVVTIAFGIGLYLQFGFAFWLAVVAALAIYIALLSAHVLIRRTETVAQLQSEIEHLRAEIASSRSAEAIGPQSSEERTAGKPVERAAVSKSHSGHGAAPFRPEPGITSGGAHDYWAASPKMSPVDAPRSQVAVPSALALEQKSVAETTSSGSPTTPLATAEGGNIDGGKTPRAGTFWDFRPADAAPASPEGPPSTGGRRKAQTAKTEPKFDRPVTHAGSSPAETPAKHQTVSTAIDPLSVLASAAVIASYSPAGPVAAKPRETVPVRSETEIGAPSLPPAVEQPAEIDGVIRRLAADINAGREHVRARIEPEPAWEDGVRALREAAQSMRDAALATDELPGPAAAASPPAFGPAHARLAEISAALATENIEVLLEPIRGLLDSRPEHYEVSLRLKLASGETMVSGDLVQTAAGSGLLPIFDALRFERTTRVARKLEERQRSGSVLSELTAESLSDDRFLNGLADTYRSSDTTAERLVLTFTQDDVRSLTEQQQATLDDMRDLGYRFAISDIVDLDMDFDALAQSGFGFVKLDAVAISRGLMTGEDLVPASDICRLFAKLGYAVVVGGIGDERQRAEVMGFGALLGQGTLFGGARPVRADLIAAPRNVAA
jgi:cyclic-di-GMP phosphodiesterase TipF (flagellum assembly factor)